MRKGIVLDRTKPALVYRAINKITGKSYIGITTMSLHERIHGHESAASAGKKYIIARAIRKYGIENFHFEVLETCINMEEAFRAEQRLIKLWKPSYNSTKGGEGGVGYKLSKQALAERSKRPGYWKGKKRDPKTIAKIAEKLRGRKLFIDTDRYAQLVESARLMRLHQKPHTPEQEAKRIQAVRAGNQKHNKPVICLTDGKEFPSMTHAETYYNLHHGAVSGIIKSGERVKRRNKRTKLLFKLKEK